MDDLRQGERFAGCRIESVAGRGGMGVVYRATELRLQRRVALKVVAPEGVADSDFTERFGREVRMAASIDHPNIVPVYGAGEEDGRLYLVMRYVDGTDLHALVRRAGALEPARAAAIVAQVAAGLDAAHAAGLVHRDVKPANVLLTRTGAAPGTDHVYLTDFGLTVEVASGSRMTTTGHWIGSVDYMAPEQLRAEDVDARTDVYALGGVLFAALTGEAPFRRDTVPQTIAAQLNDPPPRPTDIAPVDPAFDAVVARALAKDPAQRYRSAGDLGRAALAASRGERVTTGERVVARGPAAPSEERTRRLAVPPPRAACLRPFARPVRQPAPAPARGPAPARRACPRAANACRRSCGAGPGANGARRRPRAAASRRAARRTLAPAAGEGLAAPRAAEAPVRRHRTRSRVVLGLAAVLALAAAGAGAGLLADGNGARPVSVSLTGEEVRSAAQDFAVAYGGEDADALRAALARNVQRVAPDGAQRGRAAVLAVYRRQFDAADVEAYELDDLSIMPGAAGRAAGRYTVRRAGRENIEGRVAFGVVRENGVPRIALIATQPD